MELAQDSGETAGSAPVRGRPFQRGEDPRRNPSGRPRGLGRYVRELVGDDGRRLADFMLSVLDDEEATRKERMEAASWLADRGFGRAPIVSDVSLRRDDAGSFGWTERPPEERLALLEELAERLKAYHEPGPPTDGNGGA